MEVAPEAASHVEVLRAAAAATVARIPAEVPLAAASLRRAMRMVALAPTSILATAVEVALGAATPEQVLRVVTQTWAAAPGREVRAAVIMARTSPLAAEVVFAAVTTGLLVREVTAVARTPTPATLQQVLLAAAAVVGDPLPAISQDEALPVAAPTRRMLLTRSADASTPSAKTKTRKANMAQEEERVAAAATLIRRP
jgi:hypothetical protein